MQETAGSPLWERVYQYEIADHVAYQLSTETWVGVENESCTAVTLCESGGDVRPSLLHFGELA